MPSIDLNADIGEGMDTDPDLIPHLSSCSIAAGGHAGDEDTMRRTLRLVKAAGIRAGAHPSYPDREGFGRRRLDMPAPDLFRALKDQLATLRRIAEQEGVPIEQVKPHGLLYNEAATDAALAHLVAEAVKDELPGAALLGPPGSYLAEAAGMAGLPFIREGFIDRTYLPSGALTPRGAPGAVIEDTAIRHAQAEALAFGRPLNLPGGGELTLTVDSLCIHGDSPGAPETARAVRSRLEKAGVAIRAFS